MPTHRLATRARRAAAAVVMTTTAALTLTACGGLSGSSTCKDYLNASAEDQQKVVNNLAEKYNKPDYTSPLGFPAVGYACASSPNMTLDDFFKRAS